MTVNIARHDFPDNNESQMQAERLSESVIKDIDEIEESSDLIDFTFTTSLLALRAHCLVDPRAAALETWEAAVNAMQLGSALYAATNASEGTVECRINRKMRVIPTIGPLPSADAGNWLTTFWLAIICRDQARMTQLCEIPLARLKSPDGTYDEYIYHWVDVLQTYWLRKPGLVDKMVLAIETSDPAVAQITPRDMLQGLLYPPINLFYHFVRKDEQGFNPALTDSLKLHKAYWTMDQDRKSDIDGSLALGPLAIACLAFDGGFTIDVESDYLPKHLLRRGWLGEFPI
ncbi:immunity 49 family protein [Streptomyces halstedii]|uniref:immunity 49 family protein n=1 Tax=Streptomyces halstedii TaxID=1944 RepID=UPI0036C1E70C